MAEERITTKFEFDGKSLLAGLDKTTAALKQSEAEFNAATAGMDRWSESSEGLNEKLKLLNVQLEDSKRRQDIYENALKEAQKAAAKSSEELARLRDQHESLDDSVDKNSEEYKKLKQNLNEMEKIHAKNEKSVEKLRLEYTKQTAETKKTEQSIRHYSSSLDEVKQAEDAAAKSGKSVTEELNNIRKAADNAEDGVDNLNEGFTVWKGTISDLLSDGIKNFISGMFNLAESTREYRTELAKLETISDEMGANFEKTKDSYKDLIATTGDEGAATEALNNLLTAGYADNQLDEITRLVEGTAIKWKDTLKAEGLADSIQEWIGSNGASLTGNFAEALERMGYNLETVTAQTAGFTDEQRRQWIINTLTKEGLGEVSDAYRQQNDDLIAASNAQFEWNDTMAQIGEKVQPVANAVKQGMTDIVQSFLSMMSDVDFDKLAESLTAGFQWFIDNKDIILAILSGVATGFMAIKAIEFAKWLKGAITGFEGLNATMKANIFILVASLVASLIGYLVNLYKTNDEFRKKVDTAWAAVKNAISTGVNAIVTAFKNFILWVQNTWNAFLQLPGKIGQALSTALTNIQTWGSNMVTKAKEAITKLVSTVTTKMKELPGKIRSIGSDIVTGLWNGINDMASWVAGKIRGFGEGVLGGIKDFFGINSPSVVVKKEVGRMIPAGLIEGVNDEMNKVKSTMKNMGTVALNAAKSAVSGTNGTLSGLSGISGGVSSNSVPGGQNMASGSHIVFNQYNNSPKALNRWEIERQTRNTLELMRGR